MARELTVLPHVPQLLGSVWRLTHVVPHGSVKPGEAQAVIRNVS
jgi:hypothetical protein